MSHVLFRDDIINIHYQHQGAVEICNGVIHPRHQKQFSSNVWAMIVDDCLVVSLCVTCFYSNHNQEFLLHNLPKLLNDVLLAVKAQIQYLHDSALAHFGHAVKDVFKNTYHDHVRACTHTHTHRGRVLFSSGYYLVSSFMQV
jgi:hypothetical protein